MGRVPVVDIATTFPVGKPRNSAMAVYGAMSALGITGGVLSWRWVFFINIPIGLAVLAGTRALVEGQRSTGRLDTPGAISGTGAMLALAYGITCNRARPRSGTRAATRSLSARTNSGAPVSSRPSKLRRREYPPRVVVVPHTGRGYPCSERRPP